MRYIITFKNPNEKSIHVSQREGEIAMQAKHDGANVVIKGAMFDPVMIADIKPINKPYFDKDTVEASRRSELANKEERAYLESINSPQLTDGS